MVKVKDLDANTEEVVGLEELVASLRELVRGKGDRRIVYQQQAEQAAGGA